MKVSTVRQDLTSDGSEFQVCRAATEKDRPCVDSFVFMHLYSPLFHIVHMFYYCNMVGQTWQNGSLILRTLSSFSALTLLVGSLDPLKPIPDMTCNVFGETLNLTQLIYLLVIQT